jgi:chemotaxis protein methyltransferase CheR
MHDVNPLDIVETICEGVLVVEPDLTIRFANRSFYDTFAVAPEHTVGLKLYEIGNGQWDIPKLRTTLETIISGQNTIEAFEVENFFPSIGRRIIAFNARKVYRPDNKTQQILLAIEDVTERARLEREHAAAHKRIGMLLQELTHRVKNSLQFIASMVMLEARSNDSGDAKAALERVSHRITALGQLYSKLSKADTVEAVDAATYLDELCRDLIASVHKEDPTSIVLKTDIESELLPTDRAIPIGLIVNEKPAIGPSRIEPLAVVGDRQAKLPGLERTSHSSRGEVRKPMTSRSDLAAFIAHELSKSQHDRDPVRFKCLREGCH